MKTILVDFSSLNDLCGFGEIARNFAPRLAATHEPDLHFVFVVPTDCIGRFGPHIDYLDRHQLRRQLKAYPNTIDLWHATDQQFRYRRHARGTLQLLTVHDLNYLYEKKGIHLWRHQLEMPWLIRRSDFITTISNHVKTEIERHIPLLNKEPLVIYNGIADLSDKPQRRPSFIDSGSTVANTEAASQSSSDFQPFFFTIGQVRRKKNFHTLVPMMQHFPHHRLFICGDNHWPYADEIRALIAPEDRDRIVLTGMISDEEKLWLYAHCDAFLFPSTLEGFGIPVLEAMRFGARVVSSRHTCLPEVCACHAAYWSSSDPEHMADVVRKAINGWDRRSAQAAAAREHSLQFNYDRYTKQYVQLYNRLLGISR